MIRTFLKAKHWQLFLIMMGIPIMFYLIMLGSFITKIPELSNNTSDPEVVAISILGYLRFFPIIMLIYLAVFFGWFWSIAIGLQDKIPEGITMKVKRFKILFFIPLVYFTLFFIGMSLFYNSMLTSEFGTNFEPNFALIGVSMVIIIPLHLLAVFCMFHNMYFVAKTYKTVELQKEVTFSDFVGEFFMFWFYYVGIWFVQPKINKMIEENEVN